MRSHHKNDRIIDPSIEDDQKEDVDAQIGQIVYNIENMSDDNTGKTESGGSEGDYNNKKKCTNGVLDDMEDEFKEWKVPDGDKQIPKDDLT